MEYLRGDIDDTKALPVFTFANMTGENQVQYNAGIKRYLVANYGFINPGSKSTNIGDFYYAMFMKASKKDMIKKVQEQDKTVGWDLLRRGIMALSSGPEAYLLIRSQFARSLAAFSIGSYIIGIGDRHLDNFLLNLSNGGLIGIDFGQAFGTATQFLPIPPSD